MTGRVSALWRYPVKSHGREQLDSVTLTAGQTFPWDRVWAIAHTESDADGSAWARCQNFSIGAKAPRLAGIDARFDDQSGILHLYHPDLPDLSLNPDTDGDALIAWAGTLIPENRAQSARVVRGMMRGFTDTDFPSISIMNAASHRTVEGRLGRALEMERWRGNIWLDGLAPWEEFDWIDKNLRIGGAVLAVRDRAVRCAHTTASPKTGLRDTDTLGVLQEAWGHQDFGVYAEVVETGTVEVGSEVVLA
ncbi:MAG: MOSC domain-containing protein [Marinibacterium sp.]|nr:MOSC domain-containing protein [Marinibacterium sp.]